MSGLVIIASLVAGVTLWGAFLLLTWWLFNRPCRVGLQSRIAFRRRLDRYVSRGGTS